MPKPKSKVKKYNIAMVMIPLLLVPTIVSALTINAQADTSCSYTDCTTCVNLSKYITPAQITAVKGINLTSKLPSKAGNITSISYNFINNSICISGKIKPNSNNYWTMDLNGVAVIDPWWNYTTFLTLTLPNTDTNYTGDKFMAGVKINALDNVYLINVSKDAMCDATKAYVLLFSDKSQLAIADFVGNLATFSPAVSLTAGTDYLVVVNKAGANYVIRYVLGSFWPINNAHINATSSAYNQSSTWAYDANHRNLLTIGTQKNTSNYYDIELWINGAKANITTSCSGTTTNYTGLTNLTGLPISMMYNNTVVNTSTTSVSWYASLISGLWNITTNASNSSTSASTWLYHNITLGTPNVNLTINNKSDTTSCIDSAMWIWGNSSDLEEGVNLYLNGSNVSNPYITTPRSAGVYNFTLNWTTGDCYATGSQTLNITAIDCSAVATANITDGCCPIYTYMCINNDTLRQMWNTTNGISYAYQTCFNGCDNITYPAQCVKSKYQQNIYILGIIIITGIIIYAVYKWA